MYLQPLWCALHDRCFWLTFLGNMYACVYGWRLRSACMLVSSIAGQVMITCTATFPPLVFLTSVTCGYLPPRGNCALAQILATCPFTMDKSQRNYRSCLLTKSRLSVASVNVCQIHQSCERYDILSFGLF